MYYSQPIQTLHHDVYKEAEALSVPTGVFSKKVIAHRRIRPPEYPHAYKTT